MSSGGSNIQVYRKDTNLGLNRSIISVAETYGHVKYDYLVTT